MSRTVPIDELDRIDRQSVDSVMADRLIETIRALHRSSTAGWGWSTSLLQRIQWLHLAHVQGDIEEAAEWLSGWLADSGELDELYGHEWAHDWRIFAAAMRNEDSERLRRLHTPEARIRPSTCQVCARPAQIHGKDLAVCCLRHERAVRGDLPDEVCRLCSRSTICAFEVNGSPVCAACCPTTLDERARARWRARVGLDEAGAIEGGDGS